MCVVCVRTYVCISVGYLSAVMRACPAVGVGICVCVCLSVFESLNTYSNLIEMGNFNMREA